MSEWACITAGARYFDPVLGIWISPDAVKQFDNPFHFGENPINYVDKDGNLAIPIVIIPFLSTITVYATIYQEQIFSFLTGLISGYDSGHGPGYDGKVDFWGFVGAEIGANAHNIVESDELPHETLLGNVAKNLENGLNSFVKGWNQVGMAMENGIMFMGESIVEDGLWLADAGEKMLFDFNTTSNSGITNSIFISQFQGTSSGFQPTNLVIGTTAPKDLNKSTSYKNYSYEYERNINTTNTDFNKPLEQVQHSIDQVQNTTNLQNPINNIDIEIQIPEIKIDNDYQDIMNGINSDLENIRHSNKYYIGGNGYTSF